MGPIASWGVSVPEFLRKLIDTCDFSGWGWEGSRDPFSLWIHPCWKNGSYMKCTLIMYRAQCICIPQTCQAVT